MNVTTFNGETKAINWNLVRYVGRGTGERKLTIITFDYDQSLMVVEPFDDVAAELRRHTERARP